MGRRKKKVYAYIDNENVNVSVIKQGRKMDREKLYNRLKQQKGVTTVKMFMGWHPDYQKMYEFFEAIGYNLIFRQMHTHGNAPLKGNIDTELVLEAMKDLPHYDKAILVSGDGDFACLVEHLRSKKKLGGVIVPNKRRYSDFLEQAAGNTKIQSFTYLKKKLSYNPNEPHKYEYGDKDDDKNDSKNDSKKSSKNASKNTSKKSSKNKNKEASKKSGKSPSKNTRKKDNQKTTKQATKQTKNTGNTSSKKSRTQSKTTKKRTTTNAQSSNTTSKTTKSNHTSSQNSSQKKPKQSSSRKKAQQHYKNGKKKNTQKKDLSYPKSDKNLLLEDGTDSNSNEPFWM